jgi:hypothetical protein
VLADAGDRAEAQAAAIGCGGQTTRFEAGSNRLRTASGAGGCDEQADDG